MPNHCSNYLKVVGDPKEVMRFVETITVTEDGKERLQILKTIVPRPEELTNWYEWSITNWGTKWGDYDTTQNFVSVNTDKNAMVVSYSYDTAWGPAIEGIIKVSEKFPTLWFINSYQESGMAFYGTAMMHNGRKYADDGGQFPDYPEGIDSDDIEALDEAFSNINEQVFDSIERLEMSQMELYLPENLRAVAYAAP